MVPALKTTCRSNLQMQQLSPVRRVASMIVKHNRGYLNSANASNSFDNFPRMPTWARFSNTYSITYDTYNIDKVNKHLQCTLYFLAYLFHTRRILIHLRVQPSPPLECIVLDSAGICVYFKWFAAMDNHMESTPHHLSHLLYFLGWYHL